MNITNWFVAGMLNNLKQFLRKAKHSVGYEDSSIGIAVSHNWDSSIS